MVTLGVSTRKVARVAEAFGIERMSASQVSRICESLDKSVSDLCERDLSSLSWPYVWLDATYIKCRDEGHVSSCALVTAIGAGSDGYRSVLGMGTIDTESYEGWLEFLKSLRKPGVTGVKCVTSDAYEGLKKQLQRLFLESPGSAVSYILREMLLAGAAQSGKELRWQQFCLLSLPSVTPHLYVSSIS